MGKRKCIVGIDEAGYGPNLGPFVMSLVAMEVPTNCEPWTALSGVVNKATKGAKGKWIVDDSKKVHVSGSDATEIELQVVPWLGNHFAGMMMLADVWKSSVMSSEFAADEYVTLDTTWPVHGGVAGCGKLNGAMLQADVALLHLRTVMIFPREFNQLIDQQDSKAAAPLTGIERLLKDAQKCDWFKQAEEVTIAVDRLGGRAKYWDYVQDIFSETFVSTVEEGLCSRYQAGEKISISFEVKADQNHFPVALASMISKYWREVLMGQFNAFFRIHLPEVKATAGYPEDAKRFWKDVAAVREKLGLADEAWWRKR